ncbi:hypothetical protein CRENPOLYSF1_70035 [Crenothrix polyspora]|uniref:Uncharacterized protein n=1 Tax=Crenothrix polyspora TaxID=360316 RepID=A0A1R4HHY1_9GAMM|nr:hypothetical protein CRENPOLYSF1_70035 [Crenothrix polyspora]
MRSISEQTNFYQKSSLNKQPALIKIRYFQSNYFVFTKKSIGYAFILSRF